jgi:hypothetical protein
LPEEYQNCITGIKQVLKLSWQIANCSNKRQMLNTTVTVKKCNSRVWQLAIYIIGMHSSSIYAQVLLPQTKLNLPDENTYIKLISL